MSLAFAILMLVRAHRIWRAQGQLMGYHPHPNDRTEQAVRNRAAGQSPPRWYTRLHCRVLGHRAVADPAYVLPGSSAAVQRHQGFHVICGRCGTRLADSEDDLAVPDPSWFRTSDD
jgi:hypothetical protein